MVEILPLPRLYTVEAHGRPVVVISVRDEQPHDAWLSDSELTAAVRKAREHQAMIGSVPEQRGVASSDFQETLDLREIDDALAMYLGQDLRIMEDGTGQPLWDGDDAKIHVRKATSDEAEAWKHSLRAAVEAGEREASDASWVSFLVAVRDPADDAA